MNQQTNTISPHYNGTLLLEFFVLIHGSILSHFLKYIFRYKNKNGSKDLTKALDYLSWINYEEEKFFINNKQLSNKLIEDKLKELINHFNMEDNKYIKNICKCLYQIREKMVDNKQSKSNQDIIDSLKARIEVELKKLIIITLKEEENNNGL